MPYDLFPEVEREALSRASMNLGVAPPSMFEGFGKGVGMYAMRSMAETARSLSLASSILPIVQDKLAGGGTSYQDEYFAHHDATYNDAVSYWTPKPGEVGAAGQIVGSLVGSLPLVIASPALAVANTQLSAGEDLVRSGVTAGTAGTVGAIQGASLAIGLRLPYLGNTLASRVISGAAGNVVQGAGGAALSKRVLDINDFPDQAKNFDPLDPTQRTLDLLMGAAFGGLAHLDAKAQEAQLKKADLPQATKDAILTLNQAKHMEDSALPGKPATAEDLDRGVLAVKTAADQLLRGEPVNVEQITQGMRTEADPAKVAAQTETVDVAKKTAAEIVPETEPLIRSPEAVDLTAQANRATEPKAPTAQNGPEATTEPGALKSSTESGSLNGGAEPQSGAGQSADPVVDTAHRIAAERPDMQIPTGELDANGNAVTVSAAEFMAKAAESADAVKADAGLFRTAITCLLGVL